MRPDDETQSQKQKSNVIKEYLIQNLPVFQELCVLKAKGWESEGADTHFKNQRKTADESSTSKRTQYGFFKKMLEIAEEINQVTGVFNSHVNDRILDVCMAPGAFVEYAISKNWRCIVDGITLPVNSGGHEVLVRTTRRNLSITFTDITLHPVFLPPGKEIPQTFPDMEAFSSNPPLPSLATYALVICDGQRLRTHDHADRRNWEPARLLLSQLILALTHVKCGGSFLILLHRLEQWYTVSLLYQLSKFSRIQLFKPTAAHATRSSFYLIAHEVQPDLATSWVEHLERCWYTMTFGGEEGLGMGLDCSEDLGVDAVLEEFGPKLMELGGSVWTKQKDALKSSKWIRELEKN